MNVSLIDSLKNDSLNDNQSTDYVDYKAFGHDPNKSTQKRLHIKQKNRVGSIIAYAFISRVEYTGSTLLSILYHDAIITLKGNNLDKLIDLLQDEKIRFIQEYDGNYYKELSVTDNQVFIKEIEVLTLGGN